MLLGIGSKESNTVMLEEFKALLEKSVTNKTDKYWLEQVGFEINDEDNLCIVVSSDFIKSSIEKKVYSKIKSVYRLITTKRLTVCLLSIETFKIQIYMKS